MTSPLLDHQVDDIAWAHEVKRGLLANEPGLGKSRSAIEAYDGGTNLVIAPKLVLEGGTWVDELEKWSADPSKWTTIPYTSLNQRVKTGKTASSTRPTDDLNPLIDRRYDNIIMDEAHYIKGRSTTWTGAAQKLTSRADGVLMMTGTPIPNWAYETFTLLQTIFPEEAKRGKKFGGYWRWVEEWFKVSPSRYNPQARVIGDLVDCGHRCGGGTPEEPCVHYQEFIQSNFGRHIRRILREDALDLPPITTSIIKTPLDATQRRYYNELKKQFMTTIDDQEVLAWSQGSLNVLLDRITTSAWTITKDGPPRGGKLDRLRLDLESRSRPTLVFAHYRDTVDACAAVAQDLGLNVASIHGGTTDVARGKSVDRFKAGNLDVLVGSIETLAEGLTLTRADMAIFVEKSYKPSRNTQAKYRIHRIGQTRPVTILEYVTPNTVDMRKRALLDAKTDHQMRMLSAKNFKELL